MPHDHGSVERSIEEQVFLLSCRRKVENASALVEVQCAMIVNQQRKNKEENRSHLNKLPEFPEAQRFNWMGPGLQAADESLSPRAGDIPTQVNTGESSPVITNPSGLRRAPRAS